MIQHFCKLSIIAFVIAMIAVPAKAQNFVNAQPKGDHPVTFSVSATGTKHSPDLKWGADIAWKDEANLSRSKAFMGDALQVVRTSFQPTDGVDNGLSTSQMTALNDRIGWLKKHADKVQLILNMDHPGDYEYTDYYHSTSSGWIVKKWTFNVDRWVKLIDLSKQEYEKAGFTVAAIAPYNEPDYGHQGSNSTYALTDDDDQKRVEFKELAAALKAKYGNAVRICGPNTLGVSNASSWINDIGIDNLDEINTHELEGCFGDASKFNTWVNLYDTYSSTKRITQDEMHNSFEGMVGLEHGLTTGIWWGPAERVRGEFCQATHGDRLAYAEDRTRWTAATIYRAPSGQIKAFGGTSERSAQATGYRFISTERDVFFDGLGPMREYTMALPGGTAYSTGQVNAEGVVNISYGEDVQPYINGTYALYNKNTNRVLELENNNTATGTHITTGTYNIAKKYCQWNVYALSPTAGGDFCYHTISSCAASLFLDCWESALGTGTPIGVYTAGGAPQHWYFDYVGDGWFHIRSRISALCLATKADGTICQKTKDSNDDTQLWRLLPVEDTSFAVRDIDAPTGVTATAQNASVKIEWTNAVDGMKYSVFKSETSNPSEYNLIARDIKGNSFVDNKVVKGTTYYYVVKAVDASLNTSERSSEVSAAPTGAKGAVLEYGFETVLTDASVNRNDAAALDAPVYATGRASQYSAMKFDGNNFLRLSTAVGSHNTITVAAWVNWTGSSSNERIFEFAKDENNYFCLTPSGATICVNGTSTAATLPSTLGSNAWHHIAVTIDSSNMRLYVDGTQQAQKSCRQNPTAFQPFLNAIGAGQASNAENFNGLIDNFHVYNYAMSASEISTLKGEAEDTSNKPVVESDEPVVTDYVKNPYFDEDKTSWYTNETNVSWGNNAIATNQGNDITGKFYELYGGDGFTGGIYQTIENIPNGVYELKAAVFRDQLIASSDADAVFLYANDEETVVNTATPTYMKVLVEVTDGTLTIGIKQTVATYRWMGIDNVSLTYYGDIALSDVTLKSYKLDYKALQEEAEEVLNNNKYALITGKERSNLDAGRNVTPEETESGYTTAINNLQSYINTFEAALPQYQFFKQELDNGEKVGCDVATEKALFYKATVTAAELNTNFPALYEKVNAAIDDLYVFDKTSLIGTLDAWENDMVNQANGQHWDGASTYREMASAKWGLSAWTTYAEKRVVLPSGRYALRATGRTASGSVDLNMSVNYDDISRFPVKGDVGRGVTTTGEKSFNTSKTYTNSNNGRGWEYRTILFDLHKEQEVVLRVDAAASATGQWCGMANEIELWRANDVITMKMTDAGYSTLILPFDADVPEGLKAFGCSDNTEDYLILTDSEKLYANTPYIIKGAVGTYTFTGLGNVQYDDYTVGHLTGVYVDIKAPQGSYVLQKNNGKVAFYLVAEGRPTVKANRVYANIPDVSAAKNTLQFIFGDDDTTGIENVGEGNTLDSVVNVYTLGGVKVLSGKTFIESLPYLKKGVVYIINGKKVMIK